MSQKRDYYSLTKGMREVDLINQTHTWHILSQKVDVPRVTANPFLNQEAKATSNQRYAESKAHIKKQPSQQPTLQTLHKIKTSTISFAPKFSILEFHFPNKIFEIRNSKISICLSEL